MGLGAEALGRLHRRYPNLRFLKGEASAVIIERTVHAVGADLPMLNGRSGLEVAHDRQCTRNPTAFGLAAARRFTQHLGPLPGCTLHPAAR